MFQKVMAATLICGATMFTACSNSEDNPSPEPSKKNRTEFIKHTRNDLKTVAGNLNFSTWKSVNYFNRYFNQYVLLNDNFDKTLSRTVGEAIQKSIEPAPADVAERLGVKYMATLNLADFDYIFTTGEAGFNVTPNPEDGMIMEITTPYLPGQAVRISIVGSGEEYRQLDRRMSNDSVAVLVKHPSHYDFTLSTMQNDQWKEGLTVSADLTIVQGEHPDYVPDEATNVKMDAWNLQGIVKTSIPGDATEMVFNIGQDPRDKKAGLTLDYTQNSRKLISLTAELDNANGLTDLSMMTSSNSIMDVFMAIMTGNTIRDLKVTLLDDLTTTLKVSDCAKVGELQSAMASARRNYADQQTIEGYVSQLNKLVSGSMTCAHQKNNVVPMRLATVKIGVDWWAAPALDFSDGYGYVSLTDMLDKESMEYALNIIDHAAEPMQQSIIVARQLVQAMQKAQRAYYNSLNGK